GPKEIHDRNRIDHAGKGTFHQVMETLHRLDRYGVEYNILSVVTANAAKHADKIYNFFKKQNARYLQFIPCLDPYDELRGTLPHSLTPQLYERFLKELFDRWYTDVLRGEGISIRFFDNILSAAAGFPPEACGLQGRCHCQFVIEADGSVYPCDFYALNPYRIGSVTTDSFQTMQESTAAERFIKPSLTPAEKCNSCKWSSLCRGGCRRDRIVEESGDLGENYYCSALKSFFDHAVPKLIHLLRITTDYKRNML
ncbi:MAG: SPASM domain-containing protein, partial [Clostridia bacterium]|nr:SPASM domain-containing protein [Clostridia bacterium]